MEDELLLDTGARRAGRSRREFSWAMRRGIGEMDRPRRNYEAVLTETLCLVGPDFRAQKNCLEFIVRGAFQLVPSSAKAWDGQHFYWKSIVMFQWILPTRPWLPWRRNWKRTLFSLWIVVGFLSTG